MLAELSQVRDRLTEMKRTGELADDDTSAGWSDLRRTLSVKIDDLVK